jgi:hypothetical protein
MPKDSNASQETAFNLFGYEISTETRVVLVAKAPSPRKIYVEAAIIVLLALKFELVFLFFILVLCFSVAFNHCFPELVLLVVEQEFIVLIRCSDYGRKTVVRVPMSEILFVERSIRYFSTDLTFVQRGNYFHEVNFVTRGRGGRPRFYRLINRTSWRFPENPLTYPSEIADALCSFLAENGLRRVDK